MLAPAGDEQQAIVHSISLLADGRVMALWADFSGDTFPLRSSLYDPQTDNWAELAPPWDYQGYPGGLALVGLADGGALAVLSPSQDDPGATTQGAVFNPETGAWMAPLDVPIDPPFTVSDGVLLSDGRALMFGIMTASTFVFDPVTGTWDGGPALPFDDVTRARGQGHSATVLEDGSVLALSMDGHAARLPAGAVAWARSGKAAVGDYSYLSEFPGGAAALGGTRWRRGAIIAGPDPRTALFRADTNRWSPAPDSPPYSGVGVGGPGSGSVSALLADGRLLVAGGWGGGTDYSCLDGAAILDLDALAWQSIEPMPACLGSGIAGLQADGSVVIVGEGYVTNSDLYMGIGIVVLTYVP